MKINLTLSNRILFERSLPQKGTITQMIVVSDLRKKIGITQLELTDYKIKEEMDEHGNASISWELKSVPDNFTYTLTELEIGELKKVLTQLSERNEITLDLSELCRTLDLK